MRSSTAGPPFHSLFGYPVELPKGSLGQVRKTHSQIMSSTELSGGLPAIFLCHSCTN